MDFGLARLVEQDSSLTHSMAVMGSPNYMAPEQAEGHAREATTAVDVYGIGAILYEMIAGSPPFEAASPAQTLRLVLEEEPVSPAIRNPAVPIDLATICLKCLEKEPRRRYASAELLAEELDRFGRGEPIVARPVGWAERSWRWSKRKPALAVLLLALAVVFVLGFAGVSWKWRGEVSQRQLAQHETKKAFEAVTRLEIERAESLLEAGDSSRGLAYLARLLRQQPGNHIVAERLLSALTCRSFCLPVAALPHGASMNSLPETSRRELDGFFPLLKKGSVVMADFSPDGRTVVTASTDGTARLWESGSGAPVGAPLKHEAEVLWAQFSGDSRRVVTASADHCARIWAADQGNLLIPPLRHEDIVFFAQFSPDGTRVVTASGDKTVRQWDARTGQPVGAPLAHSSRPYFACYSPDGRYLLTAEVKEKAHLWNSNTGEPIQSFRQFYYKQCPAPYPQISVLGQMATLWPYNALLSNIRPNSIATFALLRHDLWTTDIRYSPDGRYIATASADSTARIWDTKTAEPIGDPIKHGGKVLSVEFRVDGQQVMTSSADKSVCLRDARGGRPLAEPMWHSGQVFSAKMNATGQRVVTVSERDTAWLWDARTLQPLTVLRWLAVPPKFVRISRDGRQLLVGDARETARVLNVESGTFQTGAVGNNDNYTISDARFSPDGRRFTTTSEDATARIWDSQTGKAIGPPLRHDRKRVLTADFSPDGQEIVTASQDGSARVWAVESGIERLRFQHGNDVECARFSPDGRLIVTASWDGTARIWDVKTGRSLFTLHHDDKVQWAIFDPAGRRVVTASKDQTARIWSVQTGRMLTPPLRHADGLSAASLSFSPDGSRLVTMAGSSAQIWDAATGLPVTPPLRHHRFIQAVHFSPDGRKVLTASDDGTARIWDAETGYAVSEPLRHGSQVKSAEFSPDGSWVVTCSSDRSVRIWPVLSGPVPAPDWLPELAEGVAGQRIDDKDETEVAPVEELYRLRQELATNTAATYYGRWVRWFFADSASRTLAPSSDLTVPEYLKRRIEENTLDSLGEATRLSAMNALAFARLAETLIAANRAPFARYREKILPSDENGGRERRVLAGDAEWFSRYATNLAPNDLEVRGLRQSVLETIHGLTNSPAAPNRATPIVQ
jgi:WD40 repeat protein